MLVLNRRPGESIIIEPGVRVTVLSVADRRVWIGVDVPGTASLRVSAAVVSPHEARLEIGPLRAVTFDGEAVRIDAAGDGHPSVRSHASIGTNRSVGQRIEVGDALWVGIASLAKGNPCVSFGGPALGEEVRVTLIRPAGNYVRLGVDAPNRRVYRDELWAAVQAAGCQAPEPAVTERAPGASQETAAPTPSPAPASAGPRDTPVPLLAASAGPDPATA